MGLQKGHGWVLLAGLAFLALPFAAAAQLCGFDCARTCAPLPCGAPLTNSHPSARVCTTGGSFNLVGTAYENTCQSGTGGCPTTPFPPLRFWVPGNFANQNSGCTDLRGLGRLRNLGVDVPASGAPPGHWIFAAQSWSDPRVEGCATGATYVAAEVSGVMMAGEGTANHGSWYVLGAGPFDGTRFNFDRIVGGNAGGLPGCAPGDVPNLPVSGLTIVGRAQACTGNATVTNGTDNANTLFFDININVGTPSALFFTDGGVSAPNLVAGYQVLYAPGATEPTTSSFASGIWRPVLDMANPTLARGIIPAGAAGPHIITLPKAGAPHWLALRIVYNDPLNPQGTFDPAASPACAGSPAACPILTSQVGPHCGPVGAGTGPICCAVEFADVRAEMTPQGVAVRWLTASEDDTIGFLVKRAADPAGAEAETAGRVTQVQGPGNWYSVIDESVSESEASDSWYYVVEVTNAGLGDRSPAVQVEAGTTLSRTPQAGTGSRTRGRARTSRDR